MHFSTLREQDANDTGMAISLFLISKGASISAKDTSGWLAIDSLRDQATRELFSQASIDFENSKDWQRRAPFLLFLHGCNFNNVEEDKETLSNEQCDAGRLPQSTLGTSALRVLFAHDHCFGVATFL